jgi:hypothetical protein
MQKITCCEFRIDWVLGNVPPVMLELLWASDQMIKLIPLPKFTGSS